MKDKNQYLVPLNNEVNQILANSIKFHPNVPDPDDQDPVEQLEYMESYIRKKQFIIIQFIKIYLLFSQNLKENSLNPKKILKYMEIALKGRKVPLDPQFIRNINVPKKIKWYFREYGKLYK